MKPMNKTNQDRDITYYHTPGVSGTGHSPIIDWERMKKDGYYLDIHDGRCKPMGSTNKWCKYCGTASGNCHCSNMYPMNKTNQEWEENIQADLDNGKFGMICSNEGNFKKYIFPIFHQTLQTEKEKMKKELIAWAGKNQKGGDSNDFTEGRFLGGYNQALLDLLNKIKTL